ncbi:DoxX family protein [Mucilaginibacter gotjawali]|uniref:Uncharacterized protein n=2 Tax=Mucilaginibacter gotjawali TaxID=1550579 RepID=A0A839SNU4_9SPHI|nr:DoxX family protein [Mucilaginibacter gotjawali]MBB3058057.1 hypothetical protein [Mucilaginibacter gotjawali]BAU52032.1 hypothetical protein MgSA37_00182 [Mucilaginibacter gotjawali]
MEVLILIALLFAGGLLSYFINVTFKFAYKLAWGYVFMAMLMGVSSWFDYRAGFNNALISWALQLTNSCFELVGHLLLGYLLMNIFLALTSSDTDVCHTRKIVGLTLWGMSIITGFAFLTESYWKDENMGRMCCFFSTSGYAPWFLYFIMAAEALGGLGILLHFKLKTGPVATAGLMLIMIGALYTHNQNHDPLSASYDAIAAFITLGILQVVYYFEQLVNPKAMDFTAVGNILQSKDAN